MYICIENEGFLSLHSQIESNWSAAVDNESVYDKLPGTNKGSETVSWDKPEAHFETIIYYLAKDLAV